MKNQLHWKSFTRTVFIGIIGTLLSTIATAKVIFISNRDIHPNIYIMDDDGTNVQRLTSTDIQGSQDYQPVWSPIGKRIAFSRYVGVPKDHLDDLYIMDQNGNNVQQLTNEPDTYYGDITWSPDGHNIAFVSFQKGGNGREIYVMDLKTKKIQQLTHHPHNAEQTYNPSWSPNGDYITYEQSISPWRISNVYVMDSNGEDPHALAPDKDWDQYSPRWSPDSKDILYTERLSEFGQPQIVHILCRVVIQKHGSDERQILNTPENWNIHSVCWMDDGKQVLIAATEGLNGRLPFDIFKYDISNENITNLTNEPAYDLTPDWISDSVYSVTPLNKIVINWGTLKNLQD